MTPKPQNLNSSAKTPSRNRRPAIVVMAGLLISCAITFWYFWPIAPLSAAEANVAGTWRWEVLPDSPAGGMVAWQHFELKTDRTMIGYHPRVVISGKVGERIDFCTGKWRLDGDTVFWVTRGPLLKSVIRTATSGHSRLGTTERAFKIDDGVLIEKSTGIRFERLINSSNDDSGIR